MIPDDPIVVDDETTQTAERYRRQRSTAVLTIMFTDIAESTKIRESLGEVNYEKMREKHESVISSVIHSENGGAVVKGTGDGHLAVFAEPSVAVERSIKIQSLMRGHECFRLRIGLDMGQVSKETMGGIVTDVFGRHVNRAARITSMTEPQHILTTYQVYDCSVGWLKSSEIGWRSRGIHDLRGFSERVSLHEPFERPQPASRMASVEGLTPTDTALHRYGADRTGQYEMDEDTKELERREVSEAVDLETPAGRRMVHLQVELSQVPRTLEEQLLTLWSALRTKEIPAQRVRGLSRFLSWIGGRAASRNSILWVDDHPQNNTALARLLVIAGCEVNGVLTTKEALARLRWGRYRAVISDMGRQGNPKAGLDLLERMRMRGINTPTVVYTSVNAAAVYGEEARRLGAVECTPGAITLVATLSRIFSR